MRLGVAAIALFALGSCASQDEAEQQIGPPQTQQDRIQSLRQYPLEGLARKKITVRGNTLRVYVADELGTRTEGLMFVTKEGLGEDEGMIFVFENSAFRKFWMKNTLLPLDIAYLKEDGAIINILTMEPLDVETPYRSTGPARYALETHAGWFEKNGVKPGDKFDLSTLKR